jgi:hypothetical protein
MNGAPDRKAEWAFKLAIAALVLVWVLFPPKPATPAATHLIAGAAR